MVAYHLSNSISLASPVEVLQGEAPSLLLKNKGYASVVVRKGEPLLEIWNKGPFEL